jgi:ParB family chromosome partitioning protein
MMTAATHDAQPSQAPAIARGVNQLLTLGLDQIVPSDQVRKNFQAEQLNSLADSLKSKGQLVPILVYFDADKDGYVLLDGERRWRAAKLAGTETLEAVVFPTRPSQAELGVAQLNLDLQREALDPVDQARAFERVMRENSWTSTQLAGEIHVALTTVTRALSILSLPDDLLELIRSGELVSGVARELARLPDEALRRTVWAQVKAESLTSAQTRKLVNSFLKEKSKPKRGRPKGTNRQIYRGLSGFEAVVSPTKVTLVPSSKKARSSAEILAALELLAQRLRDDLTTKNEASVASGLLL